MSTLIIALPLPDAPAAAEYRYALSADGVALGSQGAAPLALLPAVPRASGDIVALVPLRALSWHRVTLPKGTHAGSPRLRAVLEGLLEERLLDEPASLHFALEPGARRAERIWVAACNRAWLRDALQALEAAGRPVSRVVPEFAPPPDTGADTRHWALHAIGSSPEQGTWVAVGQGADQGITSLPLAASALVLLQPDADTPVWAEPAVAAPAEALLGRPVALQTPAERWLLAARSGWDLAQFDLASTGSTRALKKAGSWGNSLLRAPQWRAARWGALVLLAVNLVGLNAWAWREQSTLQSKQQAVRGTLQQTFPGVKVVVDAPVQMEREVALLRQATGGVSGRDLEAMLGALAQALPADKALQALEFSGAEARLKGASLSPEQINTAAAQLRAAGYSLRQDGDTLLVRAEDVK